MRSFDPYKVARWECRAWVAYYRRRWLGVLTASVGLVRAGFRMPWLPTLKGAWLVLRANQRWAPYPDNDRDGAQRVMERFYRLVARTAGEPLDAARAAELELAWWRAHRDTQHGEGGEGGEGQAAIADALVALYAFVYEVAPLDVRTAAKLRADAMEVSDRWVAAGCRLDSPLVDEERALLVRSYAALLAAVHR